MHRKIFNPAEVHKLEDPDRPTWLPPDEVLRRLRLCPGMAVADLGAGTGYFAIPIARALGDSGKVFALDLQEEMLAMLREKLAAPGLPRNIEPIHASAGRTTLPAQSCDVVLLANMWHEVDDHQGALREVARILRTGGRIALLDWRPDVSRPPGPRLERRISPASVIEALRANGWKADSPVNVGLYNYLVMGTPVR